MATFAAKIDLAFRTGLILDGFAKALHQFRKIRNEFAHESNSCSFEHSPTMDRIQSILKRNKQIYEWVRHPQPPATLRDEFDFYFAFLALTLSELATDAPTILHWKNQ